MNKLSFVETNDDANEVAWHNMRVGDEHLNLEIFIGGSMGWLKANPTKNFQDLEKELRDRNFSTHLIAKDDPNINGTSISLPNRGNNGVKYIYQCVMSCRPPKYAMEELLQSSSSYEENFEKLKYAGILCGMHENEHVEDESVRKLEGHKQTDMQKLSENRVKVSVETVSAEQFINDIKSQYPDVSTPIIAMRNDGSPIFAFVSNNTIVSQYGFSITATPTGHKIQIIELK
jgi:hypothetical protein